MVELSEAQIASVKKHLLYSGLAINQTTGFGSQAVYNTESIELEDHCKIIADEATKTQIVGVLTQLDSIQTQMGAEMQNAGLDQVSDIKFSADAFSRLRQFYDFHCDQLRALLRLNECGYSPGVIPVRSQY